jgi:hypothetical protein
MFKCEKKQRVLALVLSLWLFVNMSLMTPVFTCKAMFSLAKFKRDNGSDSNTRKSLFVLASATLGGATKK